MNTPTDIRETVSKTYAKAVTSGGGCCGGSPCSGTVQKGVLAKTAGYDAASLAGLPADAVANSFGCGNPLAFSDVQPGEVVLDLGSGAGIDLIIAAKKVGPNGRVIGVDMTDEMIARARTNIATAGHANIEIRKGYIEELPVEGGSVDWVISNCVINLSPDKPRVFREIARALKPGGRMRVSDIVAEDLPSAIRENAALYSSCVAGAISEESYLAGLRAAGLVEVEVLERQVYGAEQLTALVDSELRLDADIVALARQVEGRVWSAIVVARRPGGASCRSVS
ncbi:MAG TPA: arsenite methyltransferase [Phycisphaerae bacterium]|nr:arsenite methyltransferase [Phycisphaerae bacterium]